MKIIVLHGDDIGKSYERFQKFVTEAKRREWEILYDDLSLTLSLFGQERLTVIRDYKLITKKILSSLSKIDGTLVIYHESDLPKTFLQILPQNTKVEEFKLPKLIWNFLEHIYPGNSEKLVAELHRVIKNEAPEFVFTLAARQLRDLYWVKINSKSLPYQSWRVGKLKSQASKFQTEDLKEIINKLSEIDIQAKTGKSDLISSLDLMILKQLE